MKHESTISGTWSGLGEGPTTDALIPGATLGGFVIESMLGHGGMGIVYAARHEVSGARVALKTLRRTDATARARLKKEFRPLAQLSHRHLVELYELHAVEDVTFFTMERVEGMTLYEHLLKKRVSASDLLVEIRNIVEQLAIGLEALHSAGLLHLDLKPDNIMVTDSGVVKILDFGLAEQVHAPDGSTPGRGVAGTPHYLAPERRDGTPATKAADWYAVGRILEEATVECSPPAAAMAPLYAELSALWKKLQQRDPELRPTGTEVLAALGASLNSSRPPESGVHFVGRASELGILRERFEQARRGSPQWVDVFGESGVGKSSLIQAFRTSLEQTPQVLFLSGLCHERESVPFQGIDSVMEALAIALTQLRVEIDETDRELAATIFPRFLPGSAGKSPLLLESDVEAPVQLRRRVFSAVKRILTQVAEERTVVVVVDDAQWVDVDGARLFAELLTHPTPARLLLISVGRYPEGAPRQFHQHVKEVLDLRGTDVGHSVLDVGRLKAEDIRVCVSAGMDPLSLGVTESIVQAAQGLPFLATALARHRWESGEPPSLSRLVTRWMQRSPPGTEDVLWAVSLAPAPLPQSVALGRLPDKQAAPAVLAALRRASLIRTAGDLPDGALEPYHSLIGDAVREQMGYANQQSIRRELARKLEEQNLSRPEQLANLYFAAGELTEAARLAPLAAESAAQTLAFESAALWYGRALAWGTKDPFHILKKRGLCLEYAGRGAEAADCYERAAALSDQDHVELIQSAGSAWLASGHVDRGLGVLTPTMRRLNLPIPATVGQAMRRNPWLLFRLWKRGVYFKERKPEEIEPCAVIETDAAWHVAKALGVVLPVRGLALHLLAVHRALDSGDAQRVARSFAVLSAYMMGTPLQALGRKMQARAQEIAKRSPDPYLDGLLLGFDALVKFASWSPPGDIIATAERGLELLRRSDQVTYWEEDSVLGLSLKAKFLSCDFASLDREATVWLAEAVDRGDRFAQAIACQALAMHRIAAGDLPAARRFASESVERWARVAFTLQHYYSIRFETQCDLVSGAVEAACDRLEGGWKKMVSAQLLRNPISRAELLSLRGAVAMSSVFQGAPRLGGTYGARKCARALRREPNAFARTHGLMLEASLLAHKGLTTSALALIDQATLSYDECGMKLHSLTSRLRRAQLSRNEASREQAMNALLNVGVQQPDAYIRAHMPPMAPL